MNDIYSYAIQQVANGAKFFVNFAARTLSINGKRIIDNGKYEGPLGVEKMPLEQMLPKIEELYDAYKHSVPSERSEAKRHIYFKALKEHELANEDMMYGVRRDEAQIRLELFVLCCILNGSFVWQGKNWFWQSEKDKDLVILKQWIVNNNNQ